MVSHGFGILLISVLLTLDASGQLFTNLQSLATRLPVGDPEVPAVFSLDGPKGIGTADFDGDTKPDLAVCNTDGTITVYFGRGDGKFGAPMHLQTGSQEMRGIVCADLTGDGLPDIAVAGPYSSELFLFANEGSRTFSSASSVETWSGARNLAVGDFDGDGMRDLVIAGTTNGLRQARGIGGGAFVTMTNFLSLATSNLDFPKPVYSLEAFRPAGKTKDLLAAANADGDEVWVLSPNTNGVLEIQGSIVSPSVHALRVGPLLQAASNGAPDLVVASRDSGSIVVHRGSALSPLHFESTVAQKMEVPGGPRAVEIVDLDADGWNDLVVVLRNFDRVLIYHNSNGVLVASTEMPVGRSPREIVSADYNKDGLPDVAIMNRDSKDVSVLLTLPGQGSFGSLDQIYPVDGEVSGLSVFDFNADGRDDVIQLHRASGEFSLRLAGTNGILGEPSFFPMGALPSAQAIVDANNDGFQDIVTANLGRPGVEPGSVSVRLGNGQGGFGPEQRYNLPSGAVGQANGSLFALVAADFDGDGDIDLCAGFFDCRIAFFRGDGAGNFTFTHSHRFVYESRVMVAGDFDQDGDIDLAGAGYAGDVVVIENEGDLMDTYTLKRYEYPAPDSNKFGTRDIIATDVNRDGDLDLIVGSGHGAMLFFGTEGMGFERAFDTLPGTDFPASAVAVGDFDADGSRDLAVSCRILSCVSILSKDTNGVYQPVLSVDVPSGEYLASGDLDGDGKADLVGSGSVLWTALSSRQVQPATPKLAKGNRNTLNKPVINELVAINTDVPLDLDGGRTSDWVELYNGTASGIPMNGWKLRLTQSGGTNGSPLLTNDFNLPPTAFFTSRGYMVIVFSENKRTLYHTGFKLPGEGGTLTLLNPSGEAIDVVKFGPQQENVSYGRYRDGLPSFASNPYPSPGAANVDNGAVEPVVQLNDVTISSAQPGQPLRLTVTGRDDVGIVSLSVFWRRLDIQDNQIHRLDLFDDGDHGDGGMLDGTFSGLLEPPLPAGAEIQFYLEATDLSGQTINEPSEPVFAEAGRKIALYSLALGVAKPRLEISELVALNTTGLRDEGGRLVDWVEIRNASTNAFPLKGIMLAGNFFAQNSRLAFADSEVLQPGEHKVVYCDNEPARGPLHAPFGLNREGGKLSLFGTTTNGARFLVDTVTFGAQREDVALARLGFGGGWRTTQPTPRAANISQNWQGVFSSNRTEFTLVYPTATNRTYTVQYRDGAAGGAWLTLPAVAGDGLEHVVRQPAVQQRYYRVQSQ